MPRFYESPPWRYLLTDLDSVAITLLDKLASSRKITRTLNAPLSAEGLVPSDNPEVNRVHTDGSPFLSEGDRLLYAFRRENDAPSSSEGKWVCRAGTIMLLVEDDGDAEVSRTSFTGFDPWALAYRRPVRNPATGGLPGSAGITYIATAGDAIISELVALSISNDGDLHLDVTTGTFETTDAIDIDFQQGMSLGEAFDALVETGTLDIVIDPVYDPIVSPGVVGVLNVYESAGQARPAAIFSWDKPGRSAVTFNRQRDGRERVNRAQYYIGQGGPPVALVSDPSSWGQYGKYWEQQFFPGEDQAVAVEAFAERQVSLRESGLVTYEISPSPERSPIPFVEYDIGDTVPIYASDKLREEADDYKRVYSIPLVIGDDQMEAAVQLLFTDYGEASTGSGSGGGGGEPTGEMLFEDGFESESFAAWVGGNGGRAAACDCQLICPGGSPDPGDPLDSYEPDGGGFFWRVELREECMSANASCLNACELIKSWPNYKLGETEYLAHRVRITAPYVNQTGFCLISQLGYGQVKFNGLGLNLVADDLALYCNLGFSDTTANGHYANPDGYEVRAGTHDVEVGEWHDYIWEVTYSTIFGTSGSQPVPGRLRVYHRLPDITSSWTTLFDSNDADPGGVPTRQWGYGLGDDVTMLVDVDGLNVDDASPRVVVDKIGAYRGAGNPDDFIVDHRRYGVATTFLDAEAYLDAV